MTHDCSKTLALEFFHARNHRQHLCVQLQLQFFRSSEAVVHDVQNPDDAQSGD